MFTQRSIRRWQSAMLGLLSLAAQAETCTATDSCRIPVTFTGVYQEETCEISINGGASENLVTLPKIATAQLQRSGDEAGSRQFDITLKSCPAGRPVALHFISDGIAADSDTGNLTNRTGTGMSQGVQVRLRNASGIQLRIDDINSYQQYLIPSNGDEVTQYYSASYYAKSSKSVTPGMVNTFSGIELQYK
ncbi:fimbrial protein [Serratia sp. L9]|uniref:fimbrial protein n=1 Tax=Serratia sp. L9 TaxID=3423946 RepID=UPI003D672549